MPDKEGDVMPPESDEERAETIEKVLPRHEKSSSDQVTPGSNQLGRTQFGKKLPIGETENKTPSATGRIVTNPCFSVSKLGAGGG